MRFSDLPNELQLAVVKSCDPFTLDSLRFASKTLVALTKDIPRDRNALMSLSLEPIVKDENVEDGGRWWKEAENMEDPIKIVETSVDWKHKVYVFPLLRMFDNYRFIDMTSVQKLSLKGLKEPFHNVVFLEHQRNTKFCHLRHLILHDDNLGNPRDVGVFIKERKHLEILEIIRCKVRRVQTNRMNFISNEVILGVRDSFILEILDETKDEDTIMANMLPSGELGLSTMKEFDYLSKARRDPIETRKLIKKAYMFEKIDDQLLTKLGESTLSRMELRNINSEITIGAVVTLIEATLQTERKLHWNFGNVNSNGIETLMLLHNIEGLTWSQKPVWRFGGTSFAEEIQQFEIKTINGNQTFIFATNVE